MGNFLFVGGLKRTKGEDFHHVVQKILYDLLGIIKLEDGI